MHARAAPAERLGCHREPRERGAVRVRSKGRAGADGVVPQVLAFKCRNSQTRAAEGGPQTGWECALCDAFVCEQSEAHADHVYEFNRLVRDYMGARPDVAWGSAESLPDEADWMAWHEAHATLRVVCAGCNMGRPRPWARVRGPGPLPQPRDSLPERAIGRRPAMPASSFVAQAQ